MFLASLLYNTTQLEIQYSILCSTEYPEYENGYYLPLTDDKAGHGSRTV
jgi:hypothetical protein